MTYMQEYYKKNKEKLDIRSKQYYKDHREHQLLLQKGFAYKRKYGLTQEQVDSLFESQGGVCAICKLPSLRTLHIDHDHTSGVVRGLLCKTCNTHLGTFEKHRKSILEYLGEDKKDN